MTPRATSCNVPHGRLLLGTLGHNFRYGGLGDAREAVEEAHAQSHGQGDRKGRRKTESDRKHETAPEPDPYDRLAPIRSDSAPQ